MLAKDAGRRPHEGGRSDHELVEHAAQRIEIAAGVHQLTANLFGRNVRHGSSPVELDLELFSTRAARMVCSQAEVDDDGTTVHEQHALGLEIAIDQTLTMQERECETKLAKDAENLRKVPASRVGERQILMSRSRRDGLRRTLRVESA